MNRLDRVITFAFGLNVAVFMAEVVCLDVQVSALYAAVILSNVVFWIYGAHRLARERDRTNFASVRTRSPIWTSHFENEATEFFYVDREIVAAITGWRRDWLASIYPMSGGSEHAWFKDRDAARARAERKALPPTESHQSAAMERVSA